MTLHLMGVIHAPGHTSAQQQHAQTLMHVLAAVNTLFEQMRQEARQAVTMRDAQLRQSQALILLDELASQATTAFNGQFSPVQTTSQDRVAWMNAHLQQMAVIAF